MVVLLAMLAAGAPYRTLAAGETVGVWMTTADQSKLLAQQPSLTFGPDSGSASYTVDVNEGVTYQTIDGFGAAFTDSSAWLVASRMSAAQRGALMQRLFGSGASDIGLSMLRQPMGASDFTVGGLDYTYDDTCCDVSDFSIGHDAPSIIPVLQQARALNPSLKIIGTPWSAPAWMKSNGSLFGGTLNAGQYANYASYFVKYVQSYAAQGLPIYAVTLQNEPHHETGSYPSMRMEPAEQASFVKNNLGPAFASSGISTKIIVWDHNWDEPGYPSSVLGDAAARPYIAGSAFHCYAGAPSAQSQTRNAYPDKGIWFTECSGGEWATDFGSNLKWNMQNIIIGATRNWAKSALFWNMALDQSFGPQNGGCTNCRGVVRIDSATGNVTYNVEYYVLGHASKFVAPGAVRIDSSSYANGVETVAFRNPDGSKALIALNASAASATVKVRWGGQAFTSTLPAGAVATFKWASGASPTPTPVRTATPVPGVTYHRLTARHSGKAADVSGGSTADGALAQQWAWTGAANQQWELRPVTGTSSYQLVARHSGKCLDVRDVSTADGALVQQWACTGAANQQWELRPVTGTSYYQLVARHSGKCLDVRDVSTADGASLQQWTCTGGTNQHWTRTQL